MGQPGTPRRSFVRLPVVEDFTASLSADVPGGAKGMYHIGKTYALEITIQRV